MIVSTKSLKTKLFDSKDPLKDFRYTHINEGKRDKANNNIKTVMFCRYIGIDSDKDDYIKKLNEIHSYLTDTDGPYILFTNSLEKNFSMDEIENANMIFNKYVEIERDSNISPFKLHNWIMGEVIKNDTLEWTKKIAFKEMLEVYDKHNLVQSLSSKKNFAIKILLWANRYITNLLQNNNDKIPKVIFYGDIKRHEFYFLILLSKLGCDILYINPKEDIGLKYQEINQYSTLFRCKSLYHEIILFKRDDVDIKKEVKKDDMPKPKVHTEKKQNQRKESKTYGIKNSIKAIENRNIEKTYEELARLAESVVMINVYSSNGELVSRGSGVVISTNGFIATNFHVVEKGVVYGIVFENDNQEYISYNLVKYHPDYDLGLLKIDRQTRPIPINNTNSLVRGQKIVAIGSPMGLFNTISDGIVSGFRRFQDIEMLQITAPISPGSSGGALIDMYGNLVGITTAGFEGQNLNLAVPARYLKEFAGNVI